MNREPSEYKPKTEEYEWKPTGSIQAIAEKPFTPVKVRFEVGVSSAIRWVAQLRQTGDVAAKPRGGPRRPSRIDPHGALIMEWIETAPDLTLPEIAAKLEDAVGYRPPPSVVHDFFKRRGVTRKKRQRTPPNRTGLT